MAIVFITGSTDGLGRAAAQSLLEDGHQVVLHAGSMGRAATIAELASRSAGIVVGDLRSAAGVRSRSGHVHAAPELLGRVAVEQTDGSERARSGLFPAGPASLCPLPSRPSG